MEVPVYDSEGQCGLLQAVEQGLYTRFTSRVDTDDICRLSGIFEQGEINLGVPVPDGNRMCARISIPTHCLPQGRLLRGQLQHLLKDWHPYPGGKLGDLTLPAGQKNGHIYRFPWKEGAIIPCETLLCFFEYIQEDNQTWLQIQLSDQGIPQV